MANSGFVCCYSVTAWPAKKLCVDINIGNICLSELLSGTCAGEAGTCGAAGVFCQEGGVASGTLTLNCHPGRQAAQEQQCPGLLPPALCLHVACLNQQAHVTYGKS